MRQKLRIKRIRRKEEIQVGETYFETFQNTLEDNRLVDPIQFRVVGAPELYSGHCKELRGTWWIKTLYSYNGSKNPYLDSLGDMGVTDRPHNNHKLYQLLNGKMGEVRKLTYGTLKQMAP